MLQPDLRRSGAQQLQIAAAAPSFFVLLARAHLSLWPDASSILPSHTHSSIRHPWWVNYGAWAEGRDCFVSSHLSGLPNVTEMCHSSLIGSSHDCGFSRTRASFRSLMMKTGFVCSAARPRASLLREDASERLIALGKES